MKQHAPATSRNCGPIIAVLRRHLPLRGLVLEIASGTGEHAVAFAREFGPDLTFQPSDPDHAARTSIEAWRAESGLASLRPALDIDVEQAPWPLAAADAVLCINMIHIAPWSATVALVQGAASILPKSSPLYLYGPYRRAGVPTAPSNEAFDADLKRRNPAWGLRQLEDVVALADAAGLDHAETVAMPANNLSVILRRR